MNPIFNNTPLFKCIIQMRCEVFYDFFRNRWIFGGIVFLILLIAANVFLLQHEIDTKNQQKRAKVEDEAKRIQQEAADKAKAESQQTDQVPTDQVPIETTDPITSEITDEIVDESRKDIPNISLDPTDITSSFHGLGPFPYVPKEYIMQKGPTSWQTVELFDTEPLTKEGELISRVLFKLWEQGDTEWVGGIFKDGKVYVTYHNRVYVSYAKLRNLNGRVHKDEDRKPIRYISSWGSTGGIPKPTQEQFLAGDLPEGVEIIDWNNNDVGIEPYSFLGLDK